MAHILLIDDDDSLHILLGEYMERRQHTVSHAMDGKDGLRKFFEIHPDLVILDIMMPRMDGWHTLQRIREMSTLPVIILTARGNEPDKLQGFRMGSDDYVTKPFSFAELSARVNAVLKRMAGITQPDDNTSQVGELMLDTNRHLVMRGDALIDLTPTEFNLLAVMIREPGRVFTREQLVSRIWGDEYAEEVGYIRNYIWHLRQKIELDPDNPQYIHTVHGVGYKLAFE